MERVKRSLLRSRKNKSKTTYVGRGGWRGGGRPRGSKNKATREEKMTITQMARQYCPEAIDRLYHIMMNGKTESAQAAAAQALLDRGIGKPGQSMEFRGTGPGGSVPIADALQLAKLDDKELALLERTMAKLSSAADIDSDTE